MPVVPLESLEELFEEACSLPPGERADFLATCSKDPEVRAELASLLAAGGRAEPFFQALAFAVSPPPAWLGDPATGPPPGFDLEPAAAETAATTDPHGLVGRTVAHFEVLDILGAGGMGVVYRARDTRLGREVALKFLPPHLGADEAAKERFLVEARAVAALNHPNVCALHDVAEEGGRLYLAMGYYGGETLGRKLAGGAFPVRQAVEYARQIAAGLRAAHARGIVHRDVKPGNVLITDQGVVKLLDFGLAKLGDATLTAAGTRLGTLAYMSPEQTRGDPVSSATDLWSLGAVLYEMLTGRRPFRGESDRVVIQAIRHETPVLPSRLREEIAAGVEAIVLGLLSREPGRRESAMEWLLDERMDLARWARRKERLRELTVSAARPLAALVLVGVLTSGYLAMRGAESSTSGTLIGAGELAPRNELVVADLSSPFDPELGRAMSLALRADLDQSPAFATVWPGRLAPLLERMGLDPREPLDREALLEAAVRAGHEAVLTGEVRAIGTGFLVAAQILSAETGRPLASFRATAADSTELISATEELSRAVRARVGESMRSIRASPPLPQVTTGSLEALRHYERGVRLTGHPEGDEAAIAHLEAAIAADSGFAEAYRKLAVTLSNLDRDRARDLWLLEQAYRHRERLAPYERINVSAEYHWTHGRVDSAETLYRRSIELHPELEVYGDTRYNNFAVLLRQRGKLAESERVLERLEALYGEDEEWIRTLTSASFNNLARAEALQGKDEELDGTLERWRVAYPDDRMRAWFLVHRAIGERRFTEADSLLGAYGERHGEAGRPPTEATRTRAYLDAARGRLRAAERSLSALQRELRESGARAEALEIAVQIARLRATAGDTAAALAGLGGALEETPLGTLDALDRPYLDLARVHAELGDPGGAAELLEAHETDVDSDMVAHWSMPLLARATVAIVAGRPAEALRLIEERPAWGPTERALHPLLRGRAYEAMGRPDPVIASYREFLATRTLIPTSDAFYLADVLERLARLGEARGDFESAATYYARFVELWKDADPELQPRVRAARARLERIDGPRAAA